MRRLVWLIGLGFVVLTGSTFLGVHLAEWGARERRAERFADSLLDSIQQGGERHRRALGERELDQIAAREAAFASGVTLRETRFREDRWELAYCLGSGGALEIWVPDPNPQRRARLLFERADGTPLRCGEL